MEIIRNLSIMKNRADTELKELKELKAQPQV